MKLVKFSKAAPAGQVVFCDAAMPEVSDDEVLIKVYAAGINRADLLQKKGMYPLPEGASDTPGLEVSGVIEVLGKGVANLQIGDRVCALVEAGAFAQYCGAHKNLVFKLPDEMSFEEGASLPESLFTCWLNLVQNGKLKSGESVLIHGGGSGIGVIAIQLSKFLGAKVFATASSDEKCTKCIHLGADYAIDYNKLDFAQQVNSLSGATGVDVILDIVGRDYLDKNLSILKKYGRLVIISLLSGRSAQIDLGRVLMKNLEIIGSTLRFKTIHEKSAIGMEIRDKLWPMVGNNKSIKPVIDSVYQFEELEKAFERMENRFNFGKIVLRMAH